MFTNICCLIISPLDPTKLSLELLALEENEVQQDSLDECDLAGSIGHRPSASCTPYTSASFQSDKREVSTVLDVNGEYSRYKEH